MEVGELIHKQKNSAEILSKEISAFESHVIKFYMRSRCQVCHLADNWVDDNDEVSVECLIGRTIEDCPIIDIVWCEECARKGTNREYPDCMVCAGCRRGERRNENRMRLTDADALENMGYELHRTYRQDANTMVYEVKKIADVPTIEAEPVRRGRWHYGKCSCCGYDWSKDAPFASVPNYCPNCGARMEEQG